MAEKESGMMTRGRRNRSQSREITTSTSSSAKGPVTRSTNLESVAEVVNVQSTPINHSQKSSRTESSMSLGLNGSQHTNGSGSRATSPLSFTRAQEKEELQNLNNRLATILNRLSDSEEENRVLKVRLTTIEQETSTDLADQVNKYREELDRARAALDDVALEKDRELLAKDKALAELAETKSQLEKLKLRANDAETRAKLAEKLAREREQKLGEAKLAFTESDATRKALANEVEEVRRQLETAQGNVEQEVLCRSRLENSLKTAQEKAAFDIKLVHSKLQRQSLSVTTTVDSTQRESRRSGADFSESVQDLRDALDEAREEIEANLHQYYGKHIADLESMRDQLSSDMKALNRALDTARGDQSGMLKENKELRGKISKLEHEFDQLNQKFDQNKYDAADRGSAMNEQMNTTSQQYQQLLADYRELQNIDTDLRAELKVMHNLLSDEEFRLGITQSPLRKKRKHHESTYSTPLGQGSSRMATPRIVKSSSVRTTIKKSENKSHATGPVRILEVVPGKVVRIENTGDAVISLSDWTIIQRSESGESGFPFKQDQLINPRGIISIYSTTEVNAPSNGDTEIVGDNAWLADARLETVLVDGTGNEMAKYEVSADSDMNLEPSIESPRSRGIFGRIFGLQ